MSRFGQSEADWNADAFARAFVMPRDRFLRIVAENSDRGKCNLNAVAEKFGVEYIDVYIRGKDFNLWK